MENKEDNNISFDSKIGKAKGSKNPLIIGVIIAVIVVIALGVGYYIYRQSNITEIAIGLSDIELTDDLKSEMNSIVGQAESYFETNRAEDILTSQYGLLYSYKNKTNIIASDIAKDSSLKIDTLAEMDILYIRPADVLEGSSDNNIAIFLSVNTSSGYYVVSTNGEEATFTEEEFRNLLMKYAPTHNSVRNPIRGSDEHTAIITGAGVADSDFDIKHIACDDLYAVVVASRISNPADIREIVLMNNNGWNVINGDLAKAENSYLEINSAYPDLDLGLLPIYNLADFDAMDTVDMEPIVDSLIELNMLTEADRENIYAVGCGRFAYVQTAGGKRLVGYINDDKQLEFNEADNINEVISIMVQCEENPPVFIARFE